MKQETKPRQLHQLTKQSRGIYTSCPPPIRSSEEPPFSPWTTKKCSGPKEDKDEVLAPSASTPQRLKAGSTRYQLLARDLETVVLPEDLRIRAHYRPSMPIHKQWGDSPFVLFIPSFYDTCVEELPLHHGKAQFHCNSGWCWQGCGWMGPPLLFRWECKHTATLVSKLTEPS